MSQVTQTLKELADEVETRDDLVQFVGRLQDELVQHPQNWANNDLSSYLDAMGGWIRDMDGYYRNQGQDPSQIPPLRLLAHILLAAASYE